jgi:hypothetical protein
VRVVGSLIRYDGERLLPWWGDVCEVLSAGPPVQVRGGQGCLSNGNLNQEHAQPKRSRKNRSA